MTNNQLAKLLRETGNSLFDKTYDPNEKLLLDEAADRLENQNKWISVEDRLPENKVNCIVYYKHAYCDNDGYWAIGVSFYDGNEFQIGLAYKVTHWMPLPAPPTEKEN